MVRQTVDPAGKRKGGRVSGHELDKKAAFSLGDAALEAGMASETGARQKEA